MHPFNEEYQGPNFFQVMDPRVVSAVKGMENIWRGAIANQKAGLL